MFILVTYDVNTETPQGRRRLQRVARECVNYGHRVQNSVFECVITEAQFILFKNRIENIIDKQTDSIRFYFPGKNWHNHIEHIGRDSSLDVTETLII